MGNKVVSIITLHAVVNYGSALQAYATQHLFNDLGCTSEIVDYRRKAVLPKSVIQIVADPEYTVFQKIKYLLMYPSSKKGHRIFDDFLNSHINMSSVRYIEDVDFIKYPIEADIYCTGSDQVWNSEWHDGIPEPFFLSYAPEDKPKIAFSASFGKSELADWECDRTRELLSRYKAISVREKSGIEILEGLGINDGRLVLDPTQIVEPQLWYELAADTKLQRRYILIYQLCNNKEFDRAAVRFAREKGLELVRLCTRYDQLRKPGRGIVLPRVEEFLSLIRDADYVLTDSFHATSFCLIFRKKFVCFHPNRFSTRLESILQIAGLLNHMMEDKVETTVIDEGIDYNEIDSILLEHRKAGLDFLRQAIL